MINWSHDWKKIISGHCSKSIQKGYTSHTACRYTVTLRYWRWLWGGVFHQESCKGQTNSVGIITYFMITYLCWPFLNLHFSAFDAEHILDSFLHFKVVKNNLATKFKRTRQFKRKLFSVFSTSILSAYFTTHGSSFFLHIQANSSRVPNFKLTSGRIHFCCHQTIQSLKLLQQQ